ncbi:MAG: UDP-3-O-(3-hydroxymyristoyl)glucosamine N-acyltransferase [Verrucomicrobia bacterium]|nr:UDP-3-O-(3-hydroxymyristoyl)glucosamine N-acyltransferase [Verrucomicrobiota bacterium]
MQENKKYTLQELATLTNSELIGNPDHIIGGVESLESATSEDISFLANLRYKESMLRSTAGAVFIPPAVDRPTGRNYLISENPSVAFQKAVTLFLDSPYNKTGFAKIHETAVIHPSATIGENVLIGPYVTIDHGAKIGDHTQILSHVSVGAGVQIGDHCFIYPHVTIRERSILGNHVVIQPGAVIGSCGFGFSTNAQGIHTKLDQLGIVEIEDNVEIGANTTIDRARFKKTLISKGTKVDNLVQIGHNVKLGPHNIIVAQTGISGSAETGRHVVLGGQCGVVGHLKIADGTMIASRGGVSKSIPSGKYSGAPVLPIAEYNRQQVHLRKISEYVKRIEELEKKIEKLSSID